MVGIRAFTGVVAVSSIVALLGACSSAPDTTEADEASGEDLSRASAPGGLQIFHPCRIFPGQGHCWSILGWERHVTARPFVRLKQGATTLACVASSRAGANVIDLTVQNKTFVLQGVSRCDAPDTTAEALGRMTVRGTAVAATKSITCNDCHDFCDGLREGPIDCWGDHFDEDDDEQQNPTPCDTDTTAYDNCVASCNVQNNSGQGCGGSGAAPSSGGADCGDVFSLAGLICRMLAAF